MNYVQMTQQAMAAQVDAGELEKRVSQCSGLVKMMCGVANNCAISVVRHAWSLIADIRDKESYEKERPHHPHPGCRQKAKQLFAQFFREWAAMESTLAYPTHGDVRFFHVDDMPPEARKKYGAMTDGEYFEFWKGVGAQAFKQSMPLVTSLQNKYRKSLERNIELGVEQLRELWISVDLPFDSTIAAVEDFDKDIFRTRGEAKKSIRELTEMREDARKDHEEIKAELKNKAV